MMDFIRDALEYYGCINSKCRIEIESVQSRSFQYANVEVLVYFPRSKKPDACWVLHVDALRKLVDFNKSYFNPLKKGIDVFADKQRYVLVSQAFTESNGNFQDCII